VTVAGVILAVIVALALQTTLVRTGGGFVPIDLGLAVVVYTALSLGPLAGLFTGSLAGLGQDALSGGILGVGGLSGALIGYGAGHLGSLVIVTSFVPRLLIFFVAVVIHSVLLFLVYSLISPRVAFPDHRALLTNAAVVAVVGAVAFRVIEGWPEYARRRQLRRRALGRR